jgi:hypothetical protein
MGSGPVPYTSSLTVGGPQILPLFGPEKAQSVLS